MVCVYGTLRISLNAMIFLMLFCFCFSQIQRAQFAEPLFMYLHSGTLGPRCMYNISLKNAYTHLVEGHKFVRILEFVSSCFVL